jgi:hypothetical protein
VKSAAAFFVVWFTFGFFAWGAALGESRFEHHGWSTTDCRHDQSLSLFWGEAGGPISFVGILALSGFAEHGFQWTCPDKEPKQ